MLVLLRSPADSSVYAPRCWRGGRLLPDPTWDRFLVNAMAKEAIRADFQRRNAELQRRKARLGKPMDLVILDESSG